jgi:hypothetical protein
LLFNNLLDRFGKLVALLPFEEIDEFGKKQRIAARRLDQVVDRFLVDRACAGEVLFNGRVVEPSEAQGARVAACAPQRFCCNCLACLEFAIRADQ